MNRAQEALISYLLSNGWKVHFRSVTESKWFSKNNFSSERLINLHTSNPAIFTIFLSGNEMDRPLIADALIFKNRLINYFIEN